MQFLKKIGKNSLRETTEPLERIQWLCYFAILERKRGEPQRIQPISIFFVARTESTERFSRSRTIFRLSRSTIARMWKLSFYIVVLRIHVRIKLTTSADFVVVLRCASREKSLKLRRYELVVPLQRIYRSESFRDDANGRREYFANKVQRDRRGRKSREREHRKVSFF